MAIIPAPGRNSGEVTRRREGLDALAHRDKMGRTKHATESHSPITIRTDEICFLRPDMPADQWRTHADGESARAGFAGRQHRQLLRVYTPIPRAGSIASPLSGTGFQCAGISLQ